MAILRAYQSWHDLTKERGSRAGYNYAQERFLSQKTLHMLVSMKHQYLEQLSSIGFGPKGINMRTLSRMAKNGGDGVLAATGPDYNVNSNNYKLVVAVLCSALYPNIVQMLSPELKYKQTAAGAMSKAPEAHELKFKTKADGYVNIHPSSVNFSANAYENPYLVFHEKIKTSR